MACNAKMLEGFPFADVRSTTYNGEYYERVYFGGLVSTNAPTSTAPAWDANKTDYSIGDVVYITALKTEYICGENGNRDYPPSTGLWQPRASNDFRCIDQMPTSKTVVNVDLVNVYYVEHSNYVIGNFIDGADTVKIEAMDGNQQVTRTVATIDMYDVIDYECFSCCNPPPSKRRYFVQSLRDLTCEEKYIRVTITKRTDIDVEALRVGTLAVVRAVDAGVPSFDTRISFDNGIEFKRTLITKDVDAVRMGAVVTIEGEADILPADKKRLWQKMMEFNGLSFTIFDIPELEVLGGVIMGKFTTPDGLQIGLNLKTRYKFRKQGVLA